MTNTIKYFWPERKKAALKAIKSQLEAAEEQLDQAEAYVRGAAIRLEQERARLEACKNLVDECKITLAALADYTPEDMYKDFGKGEK